MIGDEARKLRRERAWQLRVQGLPNTAIAKELGVGEHTIREDIKEVLRLLPPPNLQQVREEENARLEAERTRLETLTRVVQQQVLKADADGKLLTDLGSLLDGIRAIARNSEKLIAISARRSRLHGADAPEQKEHSGPGGGPIPVAAAKVSIAELEAIMDENEGSK